MAIKPNPRHKVFIEAPASRTPVKGANQVRINAGVWRSRVLRFPDVAGLRPTPDRVRQTLFNWLGQDMHGQHCLDLFAGTGVMGFEALSRGAAKVVMVEKSPVALKALQENAKLLNATNADVRLADALQCIADFTRTQTQFDLILLDPPYHQQWLEKVLPLVGPLLKPTGHLYVEAEYALSDSADWAIKKSGKAGQVFYHLLLPVSGAV